MSATSKANDGWKPGDLNETDLELLRKASIKPKSTMFCFGRSWSKLRALDLVDDETDVTWVGTQFLSWLDTSVEGKKGGV